MRQSFSRPRPSQHCCGKGFIITTICHSLGFALLDAKHLRRRGTFDSLSPSFSVFGWMHLLLIYARWHIAPEKSTSKWLGWVHQSISSLHNLRLMQFTVRVPSSVYRQPKQISKTRRWDHSFFFVLVDSVSATICSRLLEGISQGLCQGDCPHWKFSPSFKALWSMHQELTQFPQTGRWRSMDKNQPRN